MNVSEQKITQALKTRGAINLANTEVDYSVTSEISKVYLHGNLIAEFNHENNNLKIDFCSYATNTTRNRINAVCEALGFKTWFNIKGGEVHQNIGKIKKGPISDFGMFEVTE